MTYTYKCRQCGIFEVERSIKDTELKQCPKCNNEIKRVFKPTGVIWNCSGACGKVG